MQFKFFLLKNKRFFLYLSILFTLFLIYYFTYLIPLTNNAFVVANIRPVAANVSGYITHIYVKNEEYVKKGQPLFTVFRKPYELAYQKAVADVALAKARLLAQEKQVLKTQSLLEVKKEMYNKVQFNYEHFRLAWKDRAVSTVEMNNLLRDQKIALAEFKALNNELAFEKQQMKVLKHKIKSVEAVMRNAKVNVDETIVYAANDGIIQNMFLALGTPINKRKPIFSFIETGSISLQANLNETELTNVHPGDKVTIVPRIYFGKKKYHGVIVSRNWAASRQVTDNRTQEQIVHNSANSWFLLPQRIPVQIKIIDYDPVHFPLSIGESAYAYIHTH
jgi:multidrug resistance efflux pump